MPSNSTVEKLSCRHAERLGEFLNHSDCGVPPPPLNIADIGAVDTSAVGIVLLAPAICLTQAANVLTKARANIHARVKTAMSAIDLQTMSDIHG